VRDRTGPGPARTFTFLRERDSPTVGDALGERSPKRGMKRPAGTADAGTATQ
jgi:hypothetical protein